MMRNVLALLLLLVAPLASAANLKAASGVKGSRLQGRRLMDKDDGDDADEGGIDIDEILGIGCFSDTATVRVEDVPTPVQMKDLRMGDKVLTARNEYSPVYTFGHRNANKVDVFVQIETANNNNNPLQMTAEHLVYMHDQRTPVRADSIQPGDMLKGAASADPIKVIATSLVVLKGVYAPLTTQGTIVVDGIAASSYVSLQTDSTIALNGWNLRFSQHEFLHVGLSPLRMACLGISASFCEGHPNIGMPSYISGAIRFQRYMEDSQPVWVQALVLGAAMVILGVCKVLEAAFGAAGAPTVLVAWTVMYLLAKALRIRIRCKVVFPRRN